MAAVTYTASNLRGGLDSTAVERAIAADATGHETEQVAFETTLLRSYGQWIEYNARVTAINDMLATVTVLLVFVAFVYVVAGVAVAGVGLTGVGALAVYLLTTIVMGSFTWIGYHMDHLGNAERRGETFEGIRLSKGTSRREGLVALREMLRPSSRQPDDREE